MGRGYTLLELVAALALLGTLMGVATPPLVALRDVASVLAAREQLVGLISAARVIAVANGGAVVAVDAAPARGRISARGRLVRSLTMAESTPGLVLDLPGGRDTTALVFDAMGIGRFASATFRFRRGSAERSVVVSAYGRVRRQ